MLAAVRGPVDHQLLAVGAVVKRDPLHLHVAVDALEQLASGTVHDHALRLD